ncbi:MAG: hypothetical protein M1819_005858 [Sarea resinae]|nr:MAG: hypothetical protein M1819_005858 [Sarea resinae]
MMKFNPHATDGAGSYLDTLSKMDASTDEKVEGGHKPKPLDLSHHWSRTTKNRTESNMKGFYKYFLIPGIANLAGGLPNESYFPYDTLEAAVALPERWKPTPNHPVDPPTAEMQAASLSDKSPASSRVLVPHASAAPDVLRKIDLTTALQYGTAQGYPPLYSFLRQFTRENLHPNVPYASGPEIILTCGSTDGFSKVLQALNNEWSEDKDWIREKEGLLVEEFAYMNAVQGAEPRGMNVAPVAMDDVGMLATGKGGLEDVLENWDLSKGKRPHLMYTVTIGQNPTGTTLTVARRKEIYALCQKYDIIIVEDDPYWYLQYPSASLPANTQAPTASSPQNQPKSSGFPFLDSLIPSYLSIDIDGRVVRLDTFSKTIAPGCRLGWITAQPVLIERILRITETSTQQPSGFVQSMVAELIIGPHDAKSLSHGGNGNGRGGSANGKGWKVAGWVRWLEGLRGEYERRMNTMCDILSEGQYLVQSTEPKAVGAIDKNDPDADADADETDAVTITKTPLYTFLRPQGGMFIWLHLQLSSHPLAPTTPLSTLANSLWEFLTQPAYLVLVSPGTIFSPTKHIHDTKGWAYFRLCFAAVDTDTVEALSRRLVSGIRDFWDVESVDEGASWRLGRAGDADACGGRGGPASDGGMRDWAAAGGMIGC